MSYFELKQHFQIESARFLPHLNQNHPCSKMHGHSFKIILTLVSQLDPNKGWVLDYGEIQEKMTPLLKRIDHQILNEVEGLENPTSELLCKWIFDRASILFPSLKKVSICETSSSECSYPAE